MPNLYTIDKNIKLNLEQVRWLEVRDEVYKCNPELAERCDSNSKYGDDYPLFKIRYPYGASMVNKGEFCFPTTDGKTISIKDERIPQFLKTHLMYSHIPLALMMDNSSEVFIKVGNRAVPLNFLDSGDLFGLFELMNILGLSQSLDTPIWDVSAGARSTFMLPSISDMISHNKIKKKLGADIYLPYNLSAHWETFVDINKYSCNTDCWQNTILVFSKEWFSNQNTPGYIEFYKYLVKKCWQQFQLLEDFTEFSLLWLSFTHEINKRNLKPRSYLIDTIKHLILIAKGSAIGFMPAINNTVLPASLIQKVYIDEYNLKDYIPNIMQPAKFVKGSKIYYSLSFPTLLESSPYFKNPPSIIEDQREIKRLLSILVNIINQTNNPSISFFKNIKFDLFHSNQDPFGQILSTKIIPENDARFLEYYNNNKETRIFCASSSFFNGCISISYE
jgi:hypothetical protein